MSLAGSSIDGYRLEEFVGAGGMGEVYRAVHTRLGRVVAIKLLSGAAVDAKGTQRFNNEARIQAGLRHPSIATLYEFLEFQGRPCIVMEYVEGQTLAQRLRERGPIPAAEALAIFRKVAEAVAYIHSQGVVHRDLKSNNIKITPSGEVRILDFGIARSPSSSRVTKIGAVIGTLENLAPEQIEGRDADFRSDVWALGVLLYEMVSGRAPFEGSTVESLYRQILRTACPRPSTHAAGIPAEVDAVVLRCLKKNPDDRYQSAADLCRALDGVPRRSLWKRPDREPVAKAHAGVRSEWLKPILLVVAVLVLALAGFAWLHGNGGTAPAALGEAKAITVDVVGGTAEVWRDGRRIGLTPFQVQARTGDRVELLLKCEGHQDVPVQFDVSERKVYSYTMEVVR